MERVEERLAAACRERNFSPKTFKAYRAWVSRYWSFCDKLPPALPSQEKARRFLDSVAGNSARATVRQALNAIVFLYDHVLKKPVGEIGAFQKARNPERLPEALSRQEVSRLFACMEGLPLLMARLQYGAGLRVSELFRLRIKDLDFDSGSMMIRQGKGAKDRSALLPSPLAYELRGHVERVRAYHDLDRRSGEPGVFMPDGLDRKYPNAGKDWGWFWLFPGKSLSRDPDTGVVRRHHRHPDYLRAALRKASALAGIPKHVKTHTLRHSFATHLLLDGVHIKRLQELLGHKDISTTERYLHCLPSLQGSVHSPLETLGNVVEFPAAASRARRSPGRPAACGSGGLG